MRDIPKLTRLQRETLAMMPQSGAELRPAERRHFDAARVLVSKGLLAWVDGRGRGFVLMPRGRQALAMAQATDA